MPIVRHHHHQLQPTFSTSSIWRLFGTENKQTQQSDTSTATSTNTTETQQSSEAEEQQEPTEIETLQKQLEEKDEQVAELNDRTLRALAEMENVRMIARRDVDNTRKYAIVPFVKSVLSVADNLHLALNSIDESKIETDNDSNLLHGLYSGVRATESEMLKVFKQYGISRFGEIGDKFDPNKYQALFEAPSEEHEPGTVISVTKSGYEMEERVIRPAEVGVARAP